MNNIVVFSGSFQQCLFERNRQYNVPIINKWDITPADMIRAWDGKYWETLYPIMQEIHDYNGRVLIYSNCTTMNSALRLLRKKGMINDLNFIHCTYNTIYHINVNSDGKYEYAYTHPSFDSMLDKITSELM